MEQTTPTGPGLTISDYLGVLRRRPLTIAIPFLVILLVGSGASFLVTPEYESVATLEVADDTALSKLFMDDAQTNVFSAKQLVSTVKQTIKRRSFLQPLVEKHRIKEGYDLSTPRGQVDLYNDHILKELNVGHVQQPKGPDVIAVQYKGQGARKVAAFVADVRDLYVEQLLDIQRDRLRVLLDTFRKAREAAENQQRVFGKRLDDFKREHQRDFFASRGRFDSRLQARMEALREAMEQASIKLDTKRRAYDRVLSRLDGQIKPKIPSEIVAEANPLHAATFAELARVQGAIDRLLNATPRHRETSRAVQLLRSQERLLNKRLVDLKPTLEATAPERDNPAYLDAIARKDELQSEIIELEAAQQARERKLTELDRRNREIPELETRFRALTDAYEEARDRRATALINEERTREYLEILRTSSGTAFRPLDTPLPEIAVHADPVFPNVPLFVLISAFIGLSVGIGLAFVLEFLSAAFLTTGQVGRVLPVQVLGGVTVIRSTASPRSRRTLTILLIIGSVLFLTLTWLHVCFFVEGMRSMLPVPVFETFQKIYGAG